MPIIKHLIEKRYGLTDWDKDLKAAWLGSPSATGLRINANKAMTCVVYFAGVRLISETVGQLPLIEYLRVQPRGKIRATNRILYTLLHDEPNSEMDAMTFKETLQGHAVTWGNAFAEIEWDVETGAPKALWPLRPDKMKVGRDDKTKEIIYVYQLSDGTTTVLPAWRVLHIPGFGFDGIIGYDTIHLAREAIAMALAMEEYGARFFGNGANPGGVLEHPNQLSKPAQENLRESWNEMHSGLSRQHRIAILEEGMKYHQVGIPPENAQFLESRKFQKSEIATLLHIPPHMIGDLEKATFSNIEHQGIEFLKYTMMPWLARWQQSCTRKLLLPVERSSYFVEFLVDALLKGDSQARASFYKELFYLGALSPNDIREKENMNPIISEGGDEYYIQANMLPMEMAGKQPAQNSLNRELLADVVKKIAERNRDNIKRNYKKSPETFDTFLDDYHRDIPDYMLKQLERVFPEK